MIRRDCTHHLAKGLSRLITSKEETATSFEKHGDVLDVRTGEVIEADLEHVKDDMWWHDLEFGEVRQEGGVLREKSQYRCVPGTS